MTNAGIWNFSMSGEEQKTVPAWERHIQSMLTALVLAGILWLADTANDNSTATQVMAVQITSMAKQIDRLEKQQFTAIDGQRLDVRIDRLEKEFRSHLRTGHLNGNH